MMQTYGPLYVGRLRYWHKKALPIIELGNTQETEMPFRFGRCLVFRFPFTTPGYYIGVFYKKVKHPDSLTDDDIDSIMEKALKARKAWSPEDGDYNEFF